MLFRSVVSLTNKAITSNGDKKIFNWVVSLLVILSLLVSIFGIPSITVGFYQESKYTAKSYIPSAYTFQWQNAMSWVRENTSQNAVFGHWWDYGYWVQTIGERATVLDGGNVLPYWDYLMGRYGLTAPTSRESLPFLYAHNTTHFLIDSTDIGKYPAFSSIGSDENYDRYSYINAFVRDNNDIKETKNSTIFVYYPGSKGSIMPLESDIIYYENGTKIFLPANRAGIIGIIVEKDASNNLAAQPRVVFFYQNMQYVLPLRYIYDSKLIDYKTGIDSGAFLFPTVSQSSVIKDGALLFLTNRTVNSQLARLYLYKEDNPYFKLIHSEDSLVVSQLKSMNILSPSEDIVYYGGIQGPIRIWEINYPSGISVNPEYLKTDYPNQKLTIAR